MASGGLVQLNSKPAGGNWLGGSRPRAAKVWDVVVTEGAHGRGWLVVLEGGAVVSSG